jgi:uncharacterized protein YqeY
MSIQTDIKDAHLTARKTKIDKSLTASLTTLKGDVNRIGFDDGKRDTTDDEVTALLKSLIKKIKGSILEAEKNNIVISAERMAVFDREIDIYSSFLPVQLTSVELFSEVDKIVSGLAEPLSNKSMGIIMGTLNKNHKGLFDGGVASQYIKGKINS